MAADSYPAGPRMVAPVHPGQAIAGALEDSRISVRQAARSIGMSPAGLNKVLLGQGPVTAGTALRIAAYLGGTPELWLRMQNDFDLWHEREELAGILQAIEPASKAAA